MGAFTRIVDLCKTSTFIMKILELVLGLTCVGLVTGHPLLSSTNTVIHNFNKEQTTYATLFGFFMLEVVIVLGYLLDYPIHRVVVLVICTIAAVMYLISGGLLIEVWHKSRPNGHGNLLGAGVLALFNGLVYGVDVSLTLMNCRSSGTRAFGQP